MTALSPVEEAVNVDVKAYRHGPAALTERLSRLTRDDLEAHVRELITRLETRAALRDHYAAERQAISELQDERRAIRAGGNR